jgi:large subunit ribosomal protein L7Ae
MAKPFYQRFDVPSGLDTDALSLLEKVRKKDDRIVRKGTNEATKAIERSSAKLVLIALDVDPAEIVGHIPLLCEDKKIPYVYVESKKTLGKSCGLDISVASAALASFADYDKDGDNIAKRCKELAKIS